MLRRVPAVMALLSTTADAARYSLEGRAVGTPTIRNLEDPLKSRLRMRAAARNRSMEEEARQILRAALQEPAVPTQDLGTRIRARFAVFGGVEMQIAPREPVREPPAIAEPAPARAKHEPSAQAPGKRRR